ncbi:MAG: hypothetical protein HZB51_11685 [Chloroflexi bacterium]|nr:hypothetical protein [Chloroflexota bacterium]
MSKIFYRERNKIGEGEKQPRFAVVGVQGTDMTFFQFHLRKSELETIAQTIGAELVMLPRGSGEHGHDGKGKGKRRAEGKKTASRRHAASA